MGSSAAASGTGSSVVRGSGDRHQLGEVGPPAIYLCPVSGMLIDTFLDRVSPSQARLARFREVAMSFLQLLSHPAQVWQQLLGYMVSTSPGIAPIPPPPQPPPHSPAVILNPL